MIPITLTTAIVLYTGLLGFLFLGIWVYTEMTVHRHQRQLGKQFLWRCVFCGYSYLDETAETLSHCPRCNSINAARDHAARAVPAKAVPEADTGSASETDEIRRNPSRQKRHHQRHRGPRRH